MRNFIALIIFISFISCQNNSAGDHQTIVPAKKETLSKTVPNPYVDKDISIMDMSYYPPEYPSLKMQRSLTTPPLARVIYSRPIKLGRQIFGGLVPFGKYWRLGANEATEIEFFKPVVIQGKRVNAGRYVIYCIPEQTKWTIILNNDVFTWGKEIDIAKDLHKFEIPVEKSPSGIEYFTMLFKDEGNATVLLMAWDDVQAKLPIQF